MEHVYDLNIRQTLEEVCGPKEIARLVHDIQLGTLRRMPGAEPVKAKALWVLNAAHAVRPEKTS